MSGTFEFGGLAITYGPAVDHRLRHHRLHRAAARPAADAVRPADARGHAEPPHGLRRWASDTNRIDALAFGLGSGIAGMAGVALSQIDNVSPNLGQSYIIDSFMVVVFGGVGNLWGTLVARADAWRRQQVSGAVRRRRARQDRAPRLHHPVHPEAAARPVRAQGPGGRSMMSQLLARVDLRGSHRHPRADRGRDRRAGAALCGAADARTFHVPTYLVAAVRQVPLLRAACRSRSISSGAIAASSRSATAPSSPSAATPWACT